MVEDNALELSSTQDLSVYDLETDDVDFCPVTPPAAISCGDIVIRDSKDVHVGNRTYYTGQVTIKQIVVPGDEAKLEAIGALPDGTLPAYNKSTNPLCESKDLSNGEKVGKFLSQWVQSPRNILLLICAAGLVCVVVFVSVYLSSKTQVKKPKEKVQNDSLSIRGRVEWGAKPAKGPIADLQQPVSIVILSSTGGVTCINIVSCSEEVRHLQEEALNKQSQSDIPYNFLVGGDGWVYEGRGWDKVSNYSGAYNNCSIEISFIGNLVSTPLTDEQIEGTKALITEGIFLGALASDYELLAYNNITNTYTHHAKIVRTLESWPNWFSNTSSIFK